MRSQRNMLRQSVPLSRLFSVVNGSTPKSDVREYWDGHIVWITPEDLSNRKDVVVTSARRQLTEAGYKSCGTAFVPPGSIILSTRAPIGNVALAGTMLCTNQGCKALVPIADEVVPRFFLYQLQSQKSALNALGSGTTFPELSSSELRRFRLLMPSKHDQLAITEFLDRETTQAERIVAKYRRLMELLEEKGVALTQQAVTKGLDPDVPMGDTGIDWIGQMPAHWDLVPLRHLVSCLDGSRRPLNAEQRGEMPGALPYWGANGIVDTVSNWLFDEELILLGEDGAPFFERGRNVAFLVNEKVWVNNHIHVLRPRPPVHAAFLAHVLNCVNYGAFIEGSTRDKLTQGSMNAIPIPLPPMHEQRNISDHIDQRAAQLSKLMDMVRRSVSLTKERLSAMISSAVTGQIDVPTCKSSELGGVA
jgi:type I restriction enzyme S subunit